MLQSMESQRVGYDLTLVTEEQKAKYLWILGFPSGSHCKESACSAETQVQALGPQDLLEKGMATHSSVLA